MKILVVDNDAASGSALAGALRAEDSTVEVSVLSERQWTRASYLRSVFDLLLLDFDSIPAGRDGSQRERVLWLRDVLRNAHHPRLVVLAREGSELLAVACMKAGAADYVPRRKANGRHLARIVRSARKRAKGVPPAALETWTGLADESPPAATAVDLSQPGRAPSKTPVSPRPSGPDLPHLPGYRLLRPLGQGGTASVFLARSEELGDNVVLKVLSRSDEETLDGEVLNRFESEYRIIASMNSQRIVDIHDFGLTADYAFIAMEYFPDGDLRRRMHSPVSVVEAVAYATQILEALAIVHAAGVLHRDLKPANVMLREDNSLALIDFGISKSETSTGPEASTGAVLGTPLYASPEQLTGNACDEHSDLYSAGVILFELLTGEKPFTGESTVAICHLHLTAPVPRLPSRIAVFQGLVDSLMAKDPKNRFPSASVALKALTTAAREFALTTAH